MNYETIIGLEVHVQLATATKLFSGSATAFGREPNSQANAIDLGLPGVLPVLNAKVVQMAIKFGLSINAQIAKQSVFARKNYFYPDLPKGYQITQHEFPIITNGYLNIELGNDDPKQTNPHGSVGAYCIRPKHINIIRAHLEEDSGKLLHEDFHGQSGIDFNRAGIPLLEIVTAPDLRSAKEAVAYLKTLHTLVRYLEISDANMQEGNFRVDVNVSVRPEGQNEFGTRCEIKNLNSFRFVEHAIDYEVQRQINLLSNGEKIIQQTLHYDPNKNVTYALRSKEEAQDYHYFPDPDLLPLIISDEEIANVRKSLPELPWQKCARFMQVYGLSKYDANILCSSIEMANYFEDICKLTVAPAKLVANWLISVETHCYASPFIAFPIKLAQLLDRVHDATISLKIAKEVFLAMLNGEGDAEQIIAAKNLQQISDPFELTKIINQVIAANPKQLEQYCAGKEALFGFFIGQVMQKTENKANPRVLNDLLKEILSSNKL